MQHVSIHSSQLKASKQVLPLPSTSESYAKVWLHIAGVEWKAKWHVGDTPMVRTAMADGIESNYASNSGACEKECDLSVLQPR